MSDELTISGDFMPALSIDAIKQRYQAIVDFANGVLREGVDYGKIPGTDNNTLLKPGAEKLSTLFGLRPRFTLQDKREDWAKGLFYYRYKCELWRGDLTMGDSEGSANSLEKKHRWRSAQRACPECAIEGAIKISKEEYGGGWYCATYKGGCNAKFPKGSTLIEDQNLGQVENPDPYDLINTLQKMAQKRALVAAVLVTVGASDFFTQDMEDFIDGEIIESKQGDIVKKTKTEPVAPTQGSLKTTSTGGKELMTSADNDTWAALYKRAKEAGLTPMGLAQNAPREAFLIRKSKLQAEIIDVERAVPNQ